MTVNAVEAYSFHLQGRRPYQEDSRWPDTDVPPAGTRTFIVCDGVGGCDSGDVASRTVCESFSKYLSELPPGRPLSNTDLKRALTHAYYDLEHAAKEGSSQMATTLTLLHLHTGGVAAAHMGDSRIYLLRPGSGIIYRSNDHSLVNSMVHRGLLSPQTTKEHHLSNVITRSLTPAAKYEDRPSLTVRHFHDCRRDDIFLLCTDGVLEYIDDAKLEAELLGGSSLEQSMNRLKALCADTHDNATAMLVKIDGPEPENAPEPEQDTYGNTRIIGKPQGETVEIDSIEPYQSLTQRIKNFFKR